MHAFQNCRLGILSLIGALVATFSAATVFAAEPNRGPWDVQRLAKPPAATWEEAERGVSRVWFAGEAWRGQPTRVFAYYARPQQGDGPFPAMVLLHGGGGKAFREWAELWAARGYVALAIDLAGNGPDGQRMADGGPGQDDVSKFGAFTEDETRDKWTYHAVASALLGHSLLAARKEVDPRRIGVTGISWGGYLTCIVAGVDERLRVAVPVYGCGFIHENSTWVNGYFRKMSDDHRARWVRHFEPSRYLAGVRCPILFVNGTNDFAYPLDSYQKSYELVDEKLRHLCVTVKMPHGHSQGWAPREIGLFVDSVLKDEPALARVGAPSIAKGVATAATSGPVPLESAQLHYTTDDGPWQQRDWRSLPAELIDGGVRAALPELPEGSGLVFFFTVRDRRDAVASSPHHQLDRKP